MTNLMRLPVIALLLCFWSVVCAQPMYKCKQADGAFSYQSDPCPQNATQQVLQADGRGTIKLAPPAAHSASRTAVNSAPPAHPTIGAVEEANSNLASDPSGTPGKPPADGVGKAKMSASTEEMIGTLLLIAMVLALIAWIWYRRYDIVGEILDRLTWNIGWPSWGGSSNDTPSSSAAATDDS